MDDLIQKLLYGDKPEEQRVPLELTSPANPWLVRPGENGVIQYESEEDADDIRFACPVKKLFHRDADASCATTPDVGFETNLSERFRFSKADAPLEKRAPKPEPETLTIKFRKNADGDVWREGYNAAGEIKECMLVSEPDEDVLSQVRE